MEQQPEPVETIVLSTRPTTRRLTPAEAHCVACIRARRRRLEAQHEPSVNGVRHWWLAFLAALVLVAVLVL